MFAHRVQHKKKSPKLFCCRLIRLNPPPPTLTVCSIFYTTFPWQDVQLYVSKYSWFKYFSYPCIFGFFLILGHPFFQKLERFLVCEHTLKSELGATTTIQRWIIVKTVKCKLVPCKPWVAKFCFMSLALQVYLKPERGSCVFKHLLYQSRINICFQHCIR